MKQVIITILAFLIVFGCKTKQDESQALIDPIVKTQNGLLQGIANESNTVVAFKGVPFAAAPVGDLRWREPQPPYDWEGIRDASKFGPSAMQHLRYSANPHTTEFMVQ